MSEPKTCEDYGPEDIHNDYVRHKREGTEPCAASKRAWANRQRLVRQRLNKKGKK